MAPLLACGSDPSSVSTATPGLIFHFPADRQLDVPTGTRVALSFSTDVDADALSSAAALSVRGPSGDLPISATVGADGKSVLIENVPFAEGETYEVIVGQALSPAAENLPQGPLFSFTTRANRPRAAAPALIAVNGVRLGSEGSPPLTETTTIRLLFSEPLDPRPIALAPGAVELVDVASGSSIPATVLANGIHMSIDPLGDLAAGQAVEVRLGDRLVDVGGVALAPTTISLTAAATRGPNGPIPQTLRTRLAGDRGPERTRSGAPSNVIVMDKPLIGREELALAEGAITAELGDPKVLGGPITFTVRRGQRLAGESLDVRLGGEIPAGLSSGELQIEFLSDADGRLYRNPFQDPAQPPDQNAPIYVDFTFDVAVSGRDPVGNAVISQTILGVRASGTAVATDGVLAIETVASMELGLLGVTSAPTNLVLELIGDGSGDVLPDREAPTVLATFPADGVDDASVGNGIEVTFSEPVDLNSALAGGLRLEDGAGLEVASALEQHGSVIVIRPLAPLRYATDYNVVFGAITDVAGNPLTAGVVSFATPILQDTNVPMTLLAVNPGTTCALTDGDGATPGRCAAGLDTDDRYAPFALPSNQNIEAVFSQPLERQTVTLGATCGAGSVRVELLDAAGACVDVVAGTFVVRERSFLFIADQPWTVDQPYRLSLISGGNDNCNGGEICSLLSGDAASFDPLDGTENNDAGGDNLIIDFVGAAPGKATFLFSDALPSSDLNGSGFIEGSETLRDSNRAAMRIVAVEGDIDEASFDMDDCLPETPEVEGCMYMLGSMPVAMGELERDCVLPGGVAAAACIPVLVSPQAMYATSMSLDADVGITIGSDTGTNIMRIRERPGGTYGFIIDDGGAPVMVLELDLYMDAPDMSIIFTDHNLHSLPLRLNLRGPVSFEPDGRILISLANTSAVEVRVTLSGPADGTVVMELPSGEMKLQLLSRPARSLER